jgi:hypothetical protein
VGLGSPKRYLEETFERDWKRGKVFCPAMYRRDHVLLTGVGKVETKPPDWCPHVFEHGIARGMTSVK